MIITTTPHIDGKRIIEYKGIVFEEVISGVNFIKDFAAGLSNFFGGRSGSYEGELIAARESALREMEQRAQDLAPTLLWAWTSTMRYSDRAVIC